MKSTTLYPKTQTETVKGTVKATDRKQSGNSQETNIIKGNNDKEGEEYTAGAAQTYTEADKAGFENFQKWIEAQAPEVSKMEQPFTIDQYKKIKERYPDSAQIRQLLLAMQNWKTLRKKNRSAYLTILNWKKIEENRS